MIVRIAVIAALVALVIVTAGNTPERAAAEPPGARESNNRGVHQGRAYRLYLPATPAPQRPLIVALHGCAQTPEDFALGTRLDKAAGRRGLRVLYPAQGAFDNPARCWNWFAPAKGETRGTHTFPAGPDATEAMLRFLVDE